MKTLLLMAVEALIALFCHTPAAHADPYCGAGSNYDPQHSICQPGNPVPYPGLDPEPLPGQYGPNYPYPIYGGN